MNYTYIEFNCYNYSNTVTETYTVNTQRQVIKNHNCFVLSSLVTFCAGKSSYLQ